MKIEKKLENEINIISLSGRLDTTTSPELDRELEVVLENATKLVFDITNLEYISSAGLRVLLKAQKAMNLKGEMIVKGANESVMEVFEITGFIDILTIEK